MSKTNNTAIIQYDIFKGEFEPSSSVAYTMDEYKFITDHITQFNLNDPAKRSDEFFRYCRDVINSKVEVRAQGIYNNYIVDLFIRSVEKLSDAQVIFIVKQAYGMAKARGRI